MHCQSYTYEVLVYKCASGNIVRAWLDEGYECSCILIT